MKNLINKKRLRKTLKKLESEGLYALLPILGSQQTLLLIRYSSQYKSKLLYEVKRILNRLVALQNLANEQEHALLEVKIRRLRTLLTNLKIDLDREQAEVESVIPQT